MYMHHKNGEFSLSDFGTTQYRDFGPIFEQLKN